MKVRVLYFASLREALGVAEEQMVLPDSVASVGDLRAHLLARGEAWQALGAGRSVRAAVNQRMVGPEARIEAGDEVAFFPPVTGG